MTAFSPGHPPRSTIGPPRAILLAWAATLVWPPGPPARAQETRIHCAMRVVTTPNSSNPKDKAETVGTAVVVEDGSAFGAYELLLISSLNDVNGLPKEGKGLIVAAIVDHALWLRIFDDDGRMVVDTDERRLSTQAGPIEELSRQLDGMWPPHKVTKGEKARLIEAIASIAGLTDFFLVTAYHVVRDATSVNFNLGGDYILQVGRGVDLEPKIYVRTATDLAIFRLTDAGVKQVRKIRPVDPRSTGAPRQPRATPVRLAAELAGQDEAVLGNQIVAIGNPNIDYFTFKPKNIIYSGTISEYAKVGDRIQNTIKIEPGSPNPVKKQTLEISLLFLETLSITRGFSGGPVLVQMAAPAAGMNPELRLAGIIMGGTEKQEVFSGRYAFACPGSHIRRGFGVLRGSTPPEADKGEAFYEFTQTAPVPGAWPSEAYSYGSTFSFSTSLVVENGPVNNEAVAGLRTVSDAGHHIPYVFETVTFEGVDFSKFAGKDLTDFHFINCEFIEPKFDGVVLNGAVFAAPVFISEAPPNVEEGILRSYGVPSMAYGVRFRDARWRREPRRVAEKSATIEAYPDEPAIFGAKPKGASGAPAPQENRVAGPGAPLRIRRFYTLFDHN